MRKSRFTCLLVFGAFLVAAFQAWAKAPTEADFLAATMTAHEIDLLIGKMPKKPSNIAIFEVRVNYPLDPTFADAIEGETVKALRENRTITVLNCFECRAPRVDVRDDKLVIKKGVPDQASIMALGKQLAVDSFLFLEVFRTRFSLVTQATLIQSSDGSILASEQIKVPALDWSEAGLQILVAGGPAMVSGGVEPATDQTGFNFGAHISALEEVGFGKAGLVVGGTSGPRGGLGFIVPTLAWRGRFGTSGIYSLASFGGGFGVSDDSGGLVLRADYTVMLGTFTVAGIDAAQLIPINTSAAGHRPVNFTAKFYIGFSLGR